MALLYNEELKNIPGGLNFLKDIRTRYDKNVAKALSESGLKLEVTLPHLPNLVFTHSKNEFYDYYLKAQGVRKTNLNRQDLGKITGIAAKLVSIYPDQPSTRYDPNTYLDYFFIGIPCDHKKLNPETYHLKQKEGRLLLWIEYANTSLYDF